MFTPEQTAAMRAIGLAPAPGDRWGDIYMNGKIEVAASSRGWRVTVCGLPFVTRMGEPAVAYYGAGEFDDMVAQLGPLVTYAKLATHRR